MLKFVFVALLCGLGFVIWDAVKNGTDKRSSSTTSTPSTPTPAAPPIERPPHYKAPVDEKTIEPEFAAMQAVYDRCSKFYVFREGSTLSSTYVPPMGQRKTAVVNVSVELASPAKADGNTLWYRVELDRKGQPTNIVATKQIAAQLCGGLPLQP